MPESNDPRGDGHSIDGDLFIVLANAEGQHCLWPAAKAPPQGWTTVGPAAPKVDCIALIESRWSDMKPKSLRDAMQTGRAGLG